MQVTTLEGASGSASATTHAQVTPALQVTKQASADSVQAGAQLTYTLRVTNTGNIVLNGVVTDTLPAHVVPTGILTWTLTNLAPNDVWLKTVAVTVEMGYSGTLVNQVQVTTLEGASGSASATAHAQVTPALQVTKQASVDSVPAGSQLTYALRVTNTGNIALNGIVTDTLPAHIAPTGVLTWSLTNLAPNDVWQKTVVVTVEMGYSGTLVNQVQVTTLEGASGSTSTTATAYTQVTPALQVTKQASSDSVQAGTQLTYTVRVTNTGNIALNGTITDTLPLHVTPIGIQTWTLTDLAPGDVWTQQVVVTVTRGYSGTLTNRVQVMTAEGATGEAQVTTNAIGYPIYLPLVLKS